MIGSKIQQAAAKILIHATRAGVSDIHVEPKEKNTKYGYEGWSNAKLRQHA